MKKITSKEQMYHVLVKDNEQTYYVTYDHFDSVFTKKQFNGSYSEKYSLQDAKYARHRFMDNYPQLPEPEIIPVD